MGKSITSSGISPTCRPRLTIPGNANGSALLGAFAIMLILGILGFTFISSAAYEADAVQMSYNNLAALWKAEEALSRAVTQIQNIRKDDLSKADGLSDRTQEAENDRFVAEYTVLRESESETSFLIAISVYERENRDEPFQKLRALVKPRSASSLFENFQESGKPYFFTGDIIDGPVHAGSPLKLAGAPVFMDVVESTVSRGVGNEWHDHFPTKAQFLKGQTWEAPEYPMGHMADLIRRGADFCPPCAKGHIAEIVFAGEQFHVRCRNPLAEKRSYSTAQTYALKKYQGIYYEGELEVRGVMNGRITVGAGGNIRITDDLVYEGSDPVTGEPRNTSSLLGLISEKSLQIRKPLSKARMDGGIRINAAMIAMDSSLETPDMRKGHMGILNIFGSISQRVRGVNGFVSFTGDRLGYTRKNWHFDRRLETEAPPFFPPLVTSDGRMKLFVVHWEREY